MVQVMKKFSYFLICISVAGTALAKHPEVIQFPQAPWTTGPLLSASAHVTTAGLVNLEPYFYRTYINGRYNSNWKKNSSTCFVTNDLELYTTIGLTKWMDLYINPGLEYNRTRGKGTFLIDDLDVGFDIQLLWDRPDNYLPALKLGLRATLPIAKYDHLDPDKYETDVGGMGSYQPYFFLCAGRLVHLWDDHWLTLFFNIEYTIPSRSHVRGLNVFGGAEDTNAYVYPPQLWDFDFAFEFTLDKHWVIACDSAYEYGSSRKFKGYPGRLNTGELADLSLGSSSFFSLAPAIEYNWSENIGLISGAWFTLAGRNADAFASWVTALNLIF